MEKELKKDIAAFLSELSKSLRQDPNYKSIYRRYQEAMREFFETLMCKVEGSGCSADKAAYIVKKIIEADEQGENISLDLWETYDLEKYPQMKNSAGKRAFWCPLTISNTKEALSLWHMYKSFKFRPLEKQIKLLSNKFTHLILIEAI